MGSIDLRTRMYKMEVNDDIMVGTGSIMSVPMPTVGGRNTGYDNVIIPCGAVENKHIHWTSTGAKRTGSEC